MASKAKFGIIDNSGERSSVNLYLLDLTGANYDDVAGNLVGNNMGDLRLAIATVCIGNFTGQSLQAVQYTDVGTIPANKYAQREIKVRFDYIDNVNGKRASFTLPCPNLDLLAESGTDNVDLEELTVAAFVAVVEANAVSVDGNAITITRGTVVGRNL